MTIPYKVFKARMLADPEVKHEYEALEAEFAIAKELIRARMRAGLSQAELAERMGTSQSAIARLESGQSLPSTKTLLRYARATGTTTASRAPASSSNTTTPSATATTRTACSAAPAPTSAHPCSPAT